MDRPYLPSLRKFRQRRALPCLLGLALFGWAAGCSNMERHIARGAAQAPTELPPLQPEHAKGEKLPAAKETHPIVSARLGFSTGPAVRQVPISLDTVFRLAESQNGQTAVARLKLAEAFANLDLAAKAWLPDLWIGAGWYRHDGGIANEDGTLTHSSFSSMFAGAELHGRFDLREAVYQKVDAERRLWQQRAEVSKLTSEALLEASTAYIDLLAARAGQATTAQVEGHLQDLLKQTTAIAKTLPAMEVEVARVQTELHGQQLLGRKMREAAMAATAKLIYLLGLDPASELVLTDRYLAAITLVNADAAVDDLVAQALENGPAVREMEGLLSLIQHAHEKSQGLTQYLPVVDLRVAEGGFGTGPGDQMTWDNRMDLGIQLKWNLTEYLTSRERQRVTQAKIGQAHATYQDLRAKLTMGVQEARDAALSGRDEMDLGQKQLKHGVDAYERTKNRFMQANIKDRSPSEVLLSIRALNLSHLAYLMAIRDHDKAQLRLAVLTGLVGRDGAH
jgi:outer membrane protein TolC